MASFNSGHKTDRNGRKVAIDEALWEQIQGVIPKGWYAWMNDCLAIRKHYGVPLSFPDSLGIVDACEVVILDGNKVMVEHDMDFNQGGNGEEDPALCGKRQLVLDSTILLPSVEDLAFILYHEAVERRAMKRGMSYELAHANVANPAEKELRMRSQPMTGASQAPDGI